MTTEQRLALIKRVGEEIITEQELIELLDKKKNPVAYDGFEPSGIAHVPFGLLRSMNLQDLMAAGIKMKLYLADWFAWINNKMGGDLQAIQTVGKYFIEVWKAAGVDTKKVELVWASDLAKKQEYWKKVVLVAKNTSVARATRCLTVMGRKENELKETAQYFYPMMQTADIFQLEVDICQLGKDQRRCNILAREVGPKLGWNKPIVISHHMLMGLEGVKKPEGYEENQQMDIEIASKMSKSKPETCIFVHDSEEDIKRKIGRAYCPERVVEGNPILEYWKHIIFRKVKAVTIERDTRFGGDIQLSSYEDLERSFLEGLHPMDLKNATALHLTKLLAPIRNHFEKNSSARNLLKQVLSYQVTR